MFKKRIINKELLEACKSLQKALSITLVELGKVCPDRKVDFDSVLTLLSAKVEAGRAIANAESGTLTDPQHGREPCKACKGTGEVDDTMHSVQAGIDMTKPCPACKPDKVKLLAEYLAKYLDHKHTEEEEYSSYFIDSYPDGSVNLDIGCLGAALEQALDAYESTENVTIKIERI